MSTPWDPTQLPEKRDWFKRPAQSVAEDIDFVEACLPDMEEDCAESGDQLLAKSLRRILADYAEVKRIGFGVSAECCHLDNLLDSALSTLEWVALHGTTRPLELGAPDDGDGHFSRIAYGMIGRCSHALTRLRGQRSKGKP